MRRNLQQELLNFCLSHAKSTGFMPTAVGGLNIVVRTQKGEKRSFNEPYAALVLQGRKRTYINDVQYEYGAGDCVITCVDLPTETVIEQASESSPFVSVVVTLNRELLSELVLSAAAVPARDAAGVPMLVTAGTDELADNFLRLLKLLDSPDSIPLLAPS